MEKYDPNSNERFYKDWLNRGASMEGVNKPSYDLIMQYLKDMEIGANVAPESKKGVRSYSRLRNLKTKMHTLTIIFQEELNLNSLADLENMERELLILFKRIRDGEIKARCNKGQPLRAAGTYVKAFKSFWHWYQRVKRKDGERIPDITVDLDAKDPKPSFNYFTLEEVKALCNEANFEYRVLMLFLFDSGIRAPTELMNVRLSDLEWDEQNKRYTLTIREESSKTFGRRIKLLLCSDILREYLNSKRFKPNDYIFKKTPQVINQYLKNLGLRVLGKGVPKVRKRKTRGRKIASNGITMYDFRHCSACYWLPRYKSESALKYRFGWKKSEMIHYYTELMGMKDTIEEEDLYIDVSKLDLERKIEEKNRHIEMMEEQLSEQSKKMEHVMKIIEALDLDKKLESNT